MPSLGMEMLLTLFTWVSSVAYLSIQAPSLSLLLILFASMGAASLSFLAGGSGFLLLFAMILLVGGLFVLTSFVISSYPEDLNFPLPSSFFPILLTGAAFFMWKSVGEESVKDTNPLLGEEFTLLFFFLLLLLLCILPPMYALLSGSSK